MIIIDNRIVSDKTFATRLISFLKDIDINDPMSEEELEYLRSVADKLWRHQLSTATEQNEIEYLIRLRSRSGAKELPRQP